MRFLTIFRPATDAAAAGERPDREAMAAYSARHAEAGVLISQAMFDPAVVEVRFDGASYAVSEKVDPAAGCAFIEAISTEAAVEHLHSFLAVAGPGTTELRRVLP